MENLLAEIMPSVVNLAFTVLLAVLTYIGTTVGEAIKKFLKDKADTETKRKVVESTCRYVEQLFADLDGSSKLLKAKENILLQLNEKNIPISELELDVLIESTVNSFKKAVNE